MSANPAITFAVPFFSGIAYLPLALESVRAQRDGRWRCLVIDDGNLEGVEGLVRSCADARFRYVKNDRNLGMAGNWNRCIDLAETDLVQLLHEDDELAPSYASTMLRAATEHP
jgi:glycosyltransferase involved in cell wall biosynthesis